MFRIYAPVAVNLRFTTGGIAKERRVSIEYVATGARLVKPRYPPSHFRRLGEREAFRSAVIEALALGILDDLSRTHLVIDPEFNAIRIAKIKFGEIAVKVLLAAMLVNSDHATLEDGEISFGGVAVDLKAARLVSPCIFAA